MPKRLSEEAIDDRVRRYLSGEPIQRIAKDHGVCFEAICHTIRRHAPNIAGTRPRGGGTRVWPEHA
jgi:hypothetical protein